MVAVNFDLDPVVCGEGDGEQGDRDQAEYGREGQGHCTAEAHGGVTLFTLPHYDNRVSERGSWETQTTG